jgi:hypothetical protein
MVARASWRVPCWPGFCTHAPGTLAAAHFIADNIVELHRDLKNRRFSTIIVCEYDPKDRKKILSTKPLTPIYRPGSS